MNIHMKKIVSLFIAIIIMSASGGAMASFTDVSQGAVYYEAVNRLKALDIINGNEKGEFMPDELLTREQFARLIIAASGQEEKAEVMKEAVIFPDISTKRWSSGYINASSQLGYIKGMLDGRFHPTESITYAQVCTVLVKMLGYSDNDVSGTWPQNYLIKAREKGITNGLSFSSNDALPRWAVAVMIDNLLDTSIKSDSLKTYSQTIEYYNEYIVLATSRTSTKIGEDEVLTDKGVFHIKDKNLKIESGKKYRLNIDDDTITGIYGDLSNVINVSVDSSAGTTIRYEEENQEKIINLPSKTIYYYDGKIQNYEDVPKLIQSKSSIVLNKNVNGTGFEYAVIFDPIYSKPEVANSYNLTNSSIGAIKFTEDMKITKDGNMIKASDIEEDDVVYKLSDIWDKNSYILVVDKSVSGEISAILPNKVSPKSIEINGVNYELSEYMNMDKLNSQGLLKVNDSATILLGYDGKVVDVATNDGEDNSQFALVINNYTEKSTAVEDFGKEYNYVKLLHTDNTVKTYRYESDETGFNGELIKYKVLDDGQEDEEDADEFKKVEIERLDLDYVGSKEFTLNKDNRKLDENYLADNVKIFNIVSTVFGGDSNAYLMNVSDLPNGKIEPGNIKYLNMAGDFDDINVMYLDNILDEDCYIGIVTSANEKINAQQKKEFTYSILVDGKSYTSIDNNDSDGVLYKGAVVKVKMTGGKIHSIEEEKSPWTKTTTVQAIDAERIKLNGTIYELESNAAIYFKDYDGSYVRKGMDDIIKGKEYGRVSVYLTKRPDYGGKVQLIMISEN